MRRCPDNAWPSAWHILSVSNLGGSCYNNSDDDYHCWTTLLPEGYNICGGAALSLGKVTLIPQGGDASREDLVSLWKRPETSEALVRICSNASRNPATEAGLEALSTQSLTLQAFPLCGLFVSVFLISLSLSISPRPPRFVSFGTSESFLRLCDYSFDLPSTVGHRIIADFLFPKASGFIHSSQLQRTDLTLPYALAFILKPCLPLSWRPPSAPWEHICSDFAHPLAS